MADSRRGTAFYVWGGLGLASFVWMPTGCTNQPLADLSQSHAAVARWGSLIPMVVERPEHTATRLKDGRVLFVGGDAGSTFALDSTEIYDPKSGKITAGPKLTVPRLGHSAALLPNGDVLIVGGVGGSALEPKKCERYSVAEGVFKPAASMRVERAFTALVQLANGNLMAIGGQDNRGVTSIVGQGSAEIYDVNRDEWTDAGSFSEVADARAFHGAIELADGRVLVVGGAFGSTILKSTLLWNPKTRIWSKGPDAIYPRSLVTLARLPDGRVVVAGGSSEYSATKTETAEVFEPGMDRFVETKRALPSRRNRSHLVALGNRVILFGDVETPESFDGTKWSILSPAAVSRLYFTATVLGDGGILLAGGKKTTNAEILQFDPEGASCSLNIDCASGVCTAGKCIGGKPVDTFGPGVGEPTPPKAISGSVPTCTKPSECTSGFCVDGVCCNEACTSECHSCALPATPGVCNLAPAGTDPRTECGPRESCLGTCGPDGSCIGSGPGASCLPAKCTGVGRGIGPAVCSARGGECRSQDVVAFDCSPYICEPAFGACRETCRSSADCLGGYVCNSGRCGSAPTSQDDAGCALAASGVVATSFGGWAGLAVLGCLVRRRQKAAAGKSANHSSVKQADRDKRA